MKLSNIIILPLHCCVNASPLKRDDGGHCVDLNIRVEVVAQNWDLSPLALYLNDPAQLLTSSTLVALLDRIGLANIPVSGNETIAATYCEPLVTNPSRQNTLQLLVHGVTYTRDYWRGTPSHYQPENYSWVEYALSQGYPILAIDRLGNGISSHPDPIATLQVPYHVRALHALIDRIKAGTIAAMPRKFRCVIFVGHSLGSIIGNNLMAQFPQDAAAAILTGFSKQALPSLLTIALVVPLPADVLDTQHYGDLSPGYLASSSYSGRRSAFYAGQFDPHIYDLDWSTQGTFGVAEAVTGILGFTTAPNYSGPVFVQSGILDAIFCAPAIPLLGQPDCGSGRGGLLDQTRQLFPASTNYEYSALPKTGHDINFHYSAHRAFVEAHTFLSSAGF